MRFKIFNGFVIANAAKHHEVVQPPSLRAKRSDLSVNEDYKRGEIASSFLLAMTYPFIVIPLHAREAKHYKTAQSLVIASAAKQSLS